MKVGDIVTVEGRVRILGPHPDTSPNFWIGDMKPGDVGIIIEKYVYRGFSGDHPWAKVLLPSGIFGWIPIEKLEIVK